MTLRRTIYQEQWTMKKEKKLLTLRKTFRCAKNNLWFNWTLKQVKILWFIEIDFFSCCETYRFNRLFHSNFVKTRSLQLSFSPYPYHKWLSEWFWSYHWGYPNSAFRLSSIRPKGYSALSYLNIQSPSLRRMASD